MAPDPALCRPKGVSTGVIWAPRWGVKGTTVTPLRRTLISQMGILRLKQGQWLVWGHREYWQDQGWGADSTDGWFAHIPTYRKSGIYCRGWFLPFNTLSYFYSKACLSGNSGGYFIFCVPFWDRRCHHISALQSLSFFLVPVQTGTLPPPQPRNSNPSPRAADSRLPAPLASLRRCLKLKISSTRLWLPPPHQWFLPILSLFHHTNDITVPSLPKWRITLHSSLCHPPCWWTPKVHLKSIPKSPPPGATPV